MKKLVILLIVSLCWTGVALGQTYDYNADFKADPCNIVNPDGVWSYGYMDAGNTTFTLHSIPMPETSGPWAGEPRLSSWHSGANPDTHGNNSINTSSDEIYYNLWPGGMYWAPNGCNLMSPDATNPTFHAVARFTAPEPDTFVINASFKNSLVQGLPGDVYVLVNGLEVDSAQISGFGFASVELGKEAPDPGSIHDYAASILLDTGDTVDFVVGRGDDLHAYHQVGFNAVIVPEPITLSLLGLGGLALIRRRRA